MTTWTIFALTLLAAGLTLETWLDARQAKNVREHRDRVPARFASVIDLAAHRKAADYTLAKLRHGRWERFWEVSLLLLWGWGGGLDALDRWIRGLEVFGTWHGVLVMLLFFTLSSLLTLPLEAWKTFGLEARFGFNRSSWRLFLSDRLKQWLLMLALASPLLWLLLWLMESTGESWWFYGWLLWSAFSLLLMWLFPNWIAPLFHRFEPLPEGALRKRIEALLARCGFSCDGLFVMDGSRRSSHGNAYFTGLGKHKRIVFFDTLLQTLDANETEAVLAHELGHFHHGHVKKRMLAMFSLSFFAFALLGWLAAQPGFYHALGVSEASHHGALLLFLLWLPWFTLWFSPWMNMLSRRHEFEADRYAAHHSDAESLISALVKLYRDNAATLTPDHLYSIWHDSHPPAPSRITALEAAAIASDPGCE